MTGVFSLTRSYYGESYIEISPLLVRQHSNLTLLSGAGFAGQAKRSTNGRKRGLDRGSLERGDRKGRRRRSETRRTLAKHSGIETESIHDIKFKLDVTQKEP